MDVETLEKGNALLAEINKIEKWVSLFVDDGDSENYFPAHSIHVSSSKPFTEQIKLGNPCDENSHPYADRIGVAIERELHKILREKKSEFKKL